MEKCPYCHNKLCGTLGVETLFCPQCCSTWKRNAEGTGWEINGKEPKGAPNLVTQARWGKIEISNEMLSNDTVMLALLRHFIPYDIRSLVYSSVYIGVSIWFDVNPNLSKIPTYEATFTEVDINLLEVVFKKVK